MNIGNNIALLRKEARLTQEQLAEKCSVSRQAVAKWEAEISEPSIDKLINLAEVFQVSIDELIKGKENDMQSKVNTEVKAINFSYIGKCIADYSQNIDLYSMGYLMSEASILSDLTLLFAVIRNKYIGPEGNVYEKYLLENTTKEEREKYVSLINRSETIDNYVNGKYEIDVALDLTIDEINNDVSQIFDVEIKKKEKSAEGQLYNLIREVVNRIRMSSILNEKMKVDIEHKLKKSLEQLHLEVEKYGKDTVLGRLWLFFEHEVNNIYKNNDIDKVIELDDTVAALKNLVWTLIPVEEEQERRRKNNEWLERRYNLESE